MGDSDNTNAKTAILTVLLWHLEDIPLALQSFRTPEHHALSAQDIDGCMAALDERPDLGDLWIAELLRQVREESVLRLDDVPKELLCFLPARRFTVSATRIAAYVRVLYVDLIRQLLSLTNAGESKDYLRCLTSVLRMQEIVGLLQGLVEGFGLNEKLSEARLEGARRAAQGRRLIGASTRERVRLEAEKHKHLTKGAAALAISERVQLSVDRVRRLLSELYPRGDWVASSDVTSQNS
ncbi:hypothetical protein NU688_30820 [Variovorax sp. ZS18.2.2]|uniref:hypothetical protein n=1 Tax=Variovorax sp. ZS18.2.2 TaxID=2971255 RepID=UPI002151613B|nr:hypothetical protein [Variovorax sp. ZS18.2.2]MCR6480582.1 hypothetical protein [Variovorax sp. ZS18.2.2]